MQGVVEEGFVFFAEEVEAFYDVDVFVAIVAHLAGGVAHPGAEGFGFGFVGGIGFVGGVDGGDDDDGGFWMGRADGL